QHSLPGLLGGGAVVDVALLVHEGMLRVVAVDGRDFTGGLEVGLEFVDRGRGAPVVLIGKVGLQRHLEVARRGDALRRQAVKANGGAQFGNAEGAKIAAVATETRPLLAPSRARAR